MCYYSGRFCEHVNYFKIFSSNCCSAMTIFDLKRAISANSFWFPERFGNNSFTEKKLQRTFPKREEHCFRWVPSSINSPQYVLNSLSIQGIEFLIGRPDLIRSVRTGSMIHWTQLTSWFKSKELNSRLLNESDTATADNILQSSSLNRKFFFWSPHYFIQSKHERRWIS